MRPPLLNSQTLPPSYQTMQAYWSGCSTLQLSLHKKYENLHLLKNTLLRSFQTTSMHQVINCILQILSMCYKTSYVLKWSTVKREEPLSNYVVLNSDVKMTSSGEIIVMQHKLYWSLTRNWVLLHLLSYSAMLSV